MRPERRSRRAGVPGILGVVALCACGQKGPLYLPDHPTSVVTHAGPADGAPAAPAPGATPQPGSDPAPQAPPRKGGEADDPARPAPPN